LGKKIGKYEVLNVSRTELIYKFLKSAKWDGATIKTLAGDASFRRYDRIFLNNKSAILMDAPPDFEDTRPFAAIARHLVLCDLCAPEILAYDFADGFLLLEDLGDNLFKKVLEINPDREYELYLNAVKALLKLNESKVPVKLSYGEGEHRLPDYDMDFLLVEVSLFSDWYFPGLTGERLPAFKREEFLSIWRKLLERVSTAKECLVLRDYHAENLIDLGQNKVGQLDFQDALVGHCAYDLVSLLQDSRRDATPATEEKLIKFFIKGLNKNEKEFREDYAVLGAQRATKIIGIFARLCLRDGKSQYLDIIPRMWGLLERCLTHPALSEMQEWLSREVPQNRDVPLNAKPLKPDCAMVLAAGLGTRMKPLTVMTPKPLIKVAGKAMLAHTLDALAAVGVQKAVINKHHHANQLEDFVQNRKDWRPKIILSDETDRLLDSGGGIKKALPDLGKDPFFVLNSDMLWTEKGQFALARLATEWRADMDILMLLVKREDAHGHDGAGDFHMDGKGLLKWRGEAATADYLYSGIMIIRPECFINAPEGAFSLRNIFSVVEKEKRLFGLLHHGQWYHVGRPSAIEDTEQLLKGK
jgi:N-acetylmuramate 1-kinase